MNFKKVSVFIDKQASIRMLLPQIHALAQKMTHNSVIDPDLYSKYNVKRGLRDLDGKGVLTGLTDISTITQNKLVDGKLVPCEGELRYRVIM